MLFPQLPSPQYFRYVINHRFCKLGIPLISQCHFSTHDTTAPQAKFSLLFSSDTCALA